MYIGSREHGSPEMNQLLQYGAACNVYYLFTQDTDLLTGPQVQSLYPKVICNDHT